MTLILVFISPIFANIVNKGINVTAYGIVRPIRKYRYIFFLPVNFILAIANDAIELINTINTNDTTEIIALFFI